MANKISRFEIEQLLMTMFKLPDEKYESIDFDELVAERFKDSDGNVISFKNLENLLNLLAPHAVVNKSELTGKVYFGFADHKNKWMVAKRGATADEIAGILEERV